MKHLQYIVVPVASRYISTHAISLQLIISFFYHLFRSRSFQDVYQCARAYLLVGAYYGAKSLLHDNTAVEPLRRITANIAVAAVVVGSLAEIIQQNSSSAYIRLGILLHSFQLLHIYFLLIAFGSELGQQNNVAQRIE